MLAKTAKIPVGVLTAKANFEEPDVLARTLQGVEGPQAPTMDEVAEELSRLPGLTVDSGKRTLVQQKKGFVGRGPFFFIADLLAGIDRVFRDSALSEPTAAVQNLTGRAPLPVPCWLADHLEICRSWRDQR